MTRRKLVVPDLCRSACDDVRIIHIGRHQSRAGKDNQAVDTARSWISGGIHFPSRDDARPTNAHDLQARLTEEVRLTAVRHLAESQRLKQLDVQVPGLFVVVFVPWMRDAGQDQTWETLADVGRACCVKLV